jgi:tripartite ATP-independent transporter DctM subunit
MFVFMASVLERSGIARDLFGAMHVLSGNLRGGLAIQTMAVAVLMAAMTGIIGGEIVLLGLVALPQMLRLNYDRKLAIGTVCAGGGLGTMIPPSIVLIFYGLTAQVSIGDLFLATVIPGLLLAGIYIAYILIRCYINPDLGPPAPVEERNLSFAEKLVMVRDILLPVLVVFMVLGSIYGGIASVSEAAGMGVIGVILCTWIRKELKWQLIRESLHQTMMTCGVILWLVFGATALIGVYNLMGGIDFVKNLMTGLPFPPIMILLIMMAILLVLGFFIDWIGIMLLTMPVFVPIVVEMGYDPIWFGILFCMNMQISYLSPPFGPAAFYLKGVAPPEISLQDIYNSLWPFMALQILGLAIVMAFPQLALWLPSLAYPN